MIAERIQTQAALGASEERYHQLFEAMGSGVVIFRPDAEGETFILQAVTQDLVQLGQHLLVWVAYPDPDAPGELKTRVLWGDSAVLGAHQELEGAVAQDCCGLPRAALAAGRPQVWTLAQPMPATVQAAGVAAAVALPLMYDQEVLGVITVLSGTAAAFDAEEVSLLEELAADLAHGVVALRTARERNEYLIQVGRAMQGTVAVLARATEMRDPYTAGHQQRVAALAVAIARDLGLSVTGPRWGWSWPWTRSPRTRAEASIRRW